MKSSSVGMNVVSNLCRVIAPSLLRRVHSLFAFTSTSAVATSLSFRTYSWPSRFAGKDRVVEEHGFWASLALGCNISCAVPESDFDGVESLCISANRDFKVELDGFDGEPGTERGDVSGRGRLGSTSGGGDVRDPATGDGWSPEYGDTEGSLHVSAIYCREFG